MGLPRPPEPFQRVYSPPEPPAPVRRPRVLALIVAVVSFVLAAGAVFFLVPGDGDRRVAPAAPGTGGDGTAATPGETPGGETPGGQTPGGETPGGQTSGGETPSPGGTAAQPEPVGSLPPPCGTVAPGTVRSLIPGAQRRESSNKTLSTCTYSSSGDSFRWLRVEAHLYSPANTPTPVDDARRYFGAQWTQAHNATLERTVSLARHPGLGDEAYRWFKADRGQPTVVGQVTVRLRNAVVTVSYSEQAGGGDAEARERDCLGKATRVAGEVLDGLR